MTSIASDKTAAPLLRLHGVVLEGHPDHITVSWDISSSYPDQTVVLLYRKADNSDIFSEVPSVQRDIGIVRTPFNLVEGIEYTLWARVEVAGYYGEWQSTVALTTDGWTNGLELVTHKGVPIYFGNDTVLVRKQGALN